MSNKAIILRAVNSVNSWDRDAAKRYIANQLGYNDRTALRVLTLALQLQATA